MKHEIPAILATGGGAIVNTASEAANHPAPHMATYVATKAGVVDLTRSAAYDFAAQNIRVNALLPGPTVTPMLMHGTKGLERDLAAFGDRLKDKKILITGLTGRIGAAVAVDLATHNQVWGLPRCTREGSREEVAALGVTAVAGDYARGSLDNVPDDFDYVLHIAASISPASAEEGMADNSDGAARLMAHCRRAKAFLHVSTTGVYDQDPDPDHVYSEENDLGGFYGGQYAATKLAGEGAVRAAAFIQNVQYGGPSLNGGLIDRFTDVFVETGQAFRPATGNMACSPIHEDDICRLIAPCLGIAAVPAAIINWSADQAVRWSELFEYAGTLLGKTPQWVDMPELRLPDCIPDTARRKAITGPSTVHWHDGIRRSLEIRHPGIQLNKGV